jgi:hypothetical protein
MNPIILLMIPLLVLAPTMAMAMTPAEDGKESGKADAFSNARDSIDACSKYSGIYGAKYNDSTPAATQCYKAYDLAFNQTCLAHPVRCQL